MKDFEKYIEDKKQEYIKNLIYHIICLIFFDGIGLAILITNIKDKNISGIVVGIVMIIIVTTFNILLYKYNEKKYNEYLKKYPDKKD